MKTLSRVAGLLLCLQGGALAQSPDAQTIVTRAYELNRVDDQTAKLTFTFSHPDREKQRVVYTMVWKNAQGRDDYDNKAIFFTEYPPEKRGIAYLGWLRAAGSALQDDEWIYLPELRMTRRVSHRDHDHAHEDDEFGNSLLKRQHLDPRPPHLDRHQLIGEEMLEGKTHYLVASTPAQHVHGHDFGKIIRWIDSQDFLTRRLQFFDHREQQVLDMRIDWLRMDDYWLWQRVIATDPRNLARTVLDISDIRINAGLDDRSFSKRTLEKGAERLR